MGRKTALDRSVPGLGRILRYFWPWVRPERRLIATSIGALLAGIALRLAEPWPLKFILDRIVAAQSGDDAVEPEWMRQVDTPSLLAACALAVVGITGLRALADYTHRVGFAKIGNRVLRKIRNRVYRHLTALSLAFHDRTRSGDMIIRVTRDVSLLRDVTSTAILPLAANVLVLAGMATIMAVLEWRLAVLAFAAVPFYWLTMVRLGRGIHDAARKQRQREGAMAATASESIHAIKSVKALSLEDAFADDFSAGNAKSQKEDMKAARLSAKLGRTVDILLSVATALVMWAGAHMVLDASITPGDLLVFLTYLRRAFKPAKDFAKYTGRLAKAAAAGERVMDVLDRKPDITDRPNAIEAPESLPGGIVFSGVDFAYEAEKPVLRGIDLEVPPGTRLALLGRSGHGKSTLVGLLLRFYDPVAGRVLLDGRDLRDYTVSSLRSRVGMVLQDTELFSGTVAENIAIAAPEASREEVEAAARFANAEGFIARLPAGYESELGERGVNLSHGERQRIAIARAAIRTSPVLVLDEPTRGLDGESEQAVVDALLRLAEGRTTLLITHDMRLAARMDEIVFLEHGRIAESGSPASLLAAGGHFADLYRLQDSGDPRHASRAD